MKKNWLRAAALLLTGISLFANGGAILAKTVVKTDVINYFQQGIVDIELDEYERKARLPITRRSCREAPFPRSRGS